MIPVKAEDKNNILLHPTINIRAVQFIQIKEAKWKKGYYDSAGI
jgi:hypothetical protein